MLLRRATMLLAFLVLKSVVVAPAMATSPVPPITVFCAPGSSAMTPENDKILQSSAENYRRLSKPSHASVWAYGEVSRSTACAYAVKKRLIELGIPAERIEVRVIGQPMVREKPEYTFVEISP